MGEKGSITFSLIFLVYWREGKNRESISPQDIHSENVEHHHSFFYVWELGTGRNSPPLSVFMSFFSRGGKVEDFLTRSLSLPVTKEVISINLFPLINRTHTALSRKNISFFLFGLLLLSPVASGVCLPLCYWLSLFAILLLFSFHFPECNIGK